jgi:hypothetical protein
MQKNSLKRLLIFLIATVLIGSCIDKNYDLNDLPDPTFSPKKGFPLPVGSLTKTVIEILRDVGISDREELIVAEQDTVYIMYMDTLSFSSPNDDMFPRPNNELPIPFVSDYLKNRELAFPITIPTGQWSSGLDSIRLINTEINVQVVSSTLPTAAEFKITLPTELELENPDAAAFTIPPGASNVSHPIRIKDYSILKLQQAGTDYQFSVSVELTTSESLSTTNGVNIEFSFSSLDAHTIWGNFDNIILDPITGRNKFMGVFTSLNDSSSLLFSDPSFKCDINNYIGIVSDLKVNEIRTDRDASHPIKAVFDDGQTEYSIPLQAALKPDGESPGKSAVLFDKNNGQIDKLFFRDPLPNHIEYSFGIEPRNGKGFLVKDGKYIDVIVDVRLPLSFNNGTRLCSVDTMELDLTGRSEIKSSKDFKLYFDYENRFCVALDMDVRFLDENKQPIPGLQFYESMTAADRWANIADARPKTGEIIFDFSDKQDKLEKVVYVALKSSAKTLGYGTTDENIVNIHPTDYFKLTLGVFGNFEIK